MFMPRCIPTLTRCNLSPDSDHKAYLLEGSTETLEVTHSLSEVDRTRDVGARRPCICGPAAVTAKSG